MHLTLEGQHDARLQMFRSRLEERGLEEYAPTKIFYSDVKQYRSVVKLVAGETDEGQFRLGMRNKVGHIVPTADCAVTVPILRKFMHVVTLTCRELDAHPYNPETAHGLRYVIARYSHYQKSIHVVLIVGKSAKFWEQLAAQLIMRMGEITGISLHINEDEGNAHYSRSENGSIQARRLEGKPIIVEKVGDYRYEIGPGDFFQNNIDVALMLQNRVLAVSEDFADRPMLDLYCGVGLFSIALAKKHGWALGVEGLKTAVRRARSNARENGVSARFIDSIVADVAYLVKREIGAHSPFIVVDPARRGLEEDVFDELEELNPAAILYVSCSAASLAKDLSQFLERGFSVEWIELYDMFPQTAHVESLTLLLPSTAPPVSGWRPPQNRRIVVQ